MARQSDNMQFTEDGLYRLGLVHQPFGEALPPYEDTTHATQLNVAISLLQGGERVLMIRGEAGLGKTTFLNQIVRQEIPVMQPVLVRAGPETDLEALCAALVREDEPAAAKGGALELDRTIAQIRGSRRSGNRPALLIDDAHRLNPRTVRELLELWLELCEKGEGFGLVMAVDPTQDQPWAGERPERLPKGRFHVVHLYPLTEQQTGDYLEHRLTEAGGDPGLLSDAEKRVVYERSGGDPRRIHEAAFDLLSERLTHRDDPSPTPPAAPRARPRKGGLLLRLSVAAGLGAVVAGAGAFWWLSTYLDPGPADPVLEITAQERPTPATTVDSDPAAARGAPEEDSPFGLVLPERYTFSREAPPERFQTDEPTEMPLETVDPPATAEAEDETTEEPKTPPVEIAAPELEPEPPAVEPALPGHQWVRGQDGSRFTVQILAASNPDTLRAYSTRHGIDGRTELVRTERQGADWYVLLYGSHATRGEAREAIDTLPSALREQGPWVRSLASVQQSLVD